MESINIYDNFLSNEDLQKCNEYVSKGNWIYGHTSSSSTGFNTPFWHMDLMKCDFFTDYLKTKIEKKLNKKFKLNRVYANGQTYGQDGSFHQDDTKINTTTFCIYTTELPHNNDDLNGYLYVKIPNNSKYIACIEPLYNRGVSFPSYYYHKGAAFNRYFQNMRICIAFKLEEIQPVISNTPKTRLLL